MHNSANLPCSYWDGELSIVHVPPLPTEYPHVHVWTLSSKEKTEVFSYLEDAMGMFFYLILPLTTNAIFAHLSMAKHKDRALNQQNTTRVRVSSVLLSEEHNNHQGLLRIVSYMITIEHQGTKDGLTLFYFPNSRFARLLPDQAQELCLLLLYFLTTWTIFETREERRKRDTGSFAVIIERERELPYLISPRGQRLRP